MSTFLFTICSKQTFAKVRELRYNIFGDGNGLKRKINYSGR